MALLDDGPLIVPINRVRQMIADSYHWRRIVDVDNPWDDDTSLDHTHIDAIDDPDDDRAYTDAELQLLRPFAIVFLAQFEESSPGAGNCCWESKGEVVANFQIPVPSTLSNDDSALGEYLTKLVGKILRTADGTKPGVLDLSGSAGYLNAWRYTVDPYERTPEDKRIQYGDFVMFDLHLFWGS